MRAIPEGGATHYVPQCPPLPVVSDIWWFGWGPSNWWVFEGCSHPAKVRCMGGKTLGRTWSQLHRGSCHAEPGPTAWINDAHGLRHVILAKDEWAWGPHLGEAL